MYVHNTLIIQEEKEIKTFQFYKLKVVPDSIFYRVKAFELKKMFSLGN